MSEWKACDWCEGSEGEMIGGEWVECPHCDGCGGSTTYDE